MSGITPPTLATESPTGASEAVVNTLGLDPGLSDDDDDADSAYNSNIQSSTESLASSIIQYRTLHGRTYHSERGNAQYWAANDEQQSISLDLFDFADAHPDCTVIGTDISPIQSTWVPPNLKFEIEDYTSPWSYSDGTFDYVHMRYLEGTIKDWTGVAKEAYKSLKPGGWIESSEASANFVSDDDSIPPNSAMAQWGPIFWKGGEQSGRSFRIYEDDIQAKCLKAAGFVDLHVKEFKVSS
ncbi:methyltransferase type 12 [Grosmannia clavigera kw1407]|uniref:Methyltransferase type 12 n=1 Tax=Grosmannia clavigera (strain kw1407 / UAMH 11150) TaxID=655863 RepID=F0XBF4_GROCL|nr:methyltransferase type 12 [Grosmannia clavigera kw1407]EFX04900.1 methyltransferase type 12 [Grosmannia clavigera kw1407]